jgi:hypothetical protein
MASMCFAFASPMLLSGFYEAYLDYNVINFLQDKTENFRLTLDMRARLLFVILCGNLEYVSTGAAIPFLTSRRHLQIKKALYVQKDNC